MPPGSLILLLLAGLVCLVRRRKRAGLALVGAGIATLFLLSTAAVSSLLARMVEMPPAPEAAIAASGAGAIVVISGGFERYAPEYGGNAVDAITLQRLRYAAHLARRLDLPILVSGGRPDDAEVSLAAMMKQALEQDFALQVRWVEGNARDTFENAVFSAGLLKSDGVDTIVLVTHATHMARSMRVFAAAGLKVVPAPTVFAPISYGIAPSLSALYESYFALYETLGSAWYALRHGGAGAR